MGRDLCLHVCGLLGSAAEYLANNKLKLYEELLGNYEFVPFAVETSGVWCSAAKLFVRELGWRLMKRSGDPRAGTFLVQQLSIAIQRGNAASVMGTFGPGTCRGLTKVLCKMLEVCVDSLQSAINAVCNGADELEVCSSLHEGGLTPTAGLVQQIMNMALYDKSDLLELSNATKSINKIPKVNVMIRCRPGSDFCYSDSEMDTMLSDIEIFKGMGVHRFVFGSLTDSQQIDDEHCIRVLAQAYPIPVTFHRAIDVSAEPIAALDEIIQLGFDRVLTSGQQNSAEDPEAIELIKTMLKLYGDSIEIMPGAGITPDNVRIFLDFGCKIVHSSCKKLRPLSKGNNKLVLDNCQYVYVTDGDIVKKMKDIMSE